MSVGIDIVQISRIQKALQNPHFADKILTDAEKNQGTHNSIQSTAASFAAKEAFSKALGTGMRGFGFCDISVLHDELGKPYMQFSADVEAMLRSKGIQSCELSLSHEKEYAVATVILKYCKSYSRYNSVISKFKDICSDNVITPQMVKRIIPKRTEDMHKGDCGRLFLLAGSAGLTGAAVMASKSALRSGAGLITLGCAKSLNSIFECSIAEVMTMPLADTNGVINCNDTDKIMHRAALSDCVLAGPGLTQSADTAKTVQQLVKKCTKTLVLDADGINVLTQNINISDSNCDIILTPHIGEFSRISGLDCDTILADPAMHASEFALQHKVTVVLKSHRTVIATPTGDVYTNILGNPGMATGGSGDVLSGIIASFAAQGFGTANAATAGVYIHSLAADMAACELGEYGLTPSDIIDYVPYAIKYTIEQ